MGHFRIECLMRLQLKSLSTPRSCSLIMISFYFFIFIISNPSCVLIIITYSDLQFTYKTCMTNVYHRYRAVQLCVHARMQISSSVITQNYWNRGWKILALKFRIMFHDILHKAFFIFLPLDKVDVAAESFRQ